MEVFGGHWAVEGGVLGTVLGPCGSSVSSQREGLELGRERRRLLDPNLQHYNRITRSGSGAEPKTGDRTLSFHLYLVSQFALCP